ncbi:MAG: hypothetical protein HQ513_01965 [Rhodospirillales bacterium]|nr:hypothetical protein [Rhodospirillales bacterium]
MFAELSEDNPYPRILRMRHPDVLQFAEPISVYSVCPEQVALELANQKDVRDLEDHGYGLITVDQNGAARRKFAAVPLIQVISNGDFKAQLEGLNTKQKQRIALAYEDYKNKPSTGVTTLTEVIEGLAMQAAKEAARKKWIKSAEAKGAVGDALDAMYGCGKCNNARAAIGGVRGYIASYRNMNHHWPKNKKKAQQRYTQCRLAFLEGLSQMRNFRIAMKGIGLSGNLPNA